jgi:tellurite resistance protein TehA-like permease
MARANLLAGWVLVLLAALALGGALRLPIGRPGSPEPGFVPLIEAIVLGLTGLALIADARKTRGDKPVDWPAEEPKRMIFHLSLTMIGYILVMPVAGFTLSTFLFLVVAIRAWRRYSIPATAGYAALMTLVIQVTFSVALSMPLPSGLYGLP